MRFLGLLALVVVSPLACAQVKRAPDGAHEPGIDADAGLSPGDADDSGVDGGGGDAGAPPPLDFECSGTWEDPSSQKPECRDRIVTIVDPNGGPGARSLSLARTPAGRVGIAFFSVSSFEAGDMRLWHFVPSALGAASGKPVLLTRPATSYAFMAGFDVRLGASGPDVLHVLAHDVESGTSGDLLYFTLTNGARALAPPGGELVQGRVPRKTEIALGVRTPTDILALARMPEGSQSIPKPLAKLVARQRAGTVWNALPDVVSGLSPSEAPEVGAASILFDPAGAPGVGFHWANEQNVSQPHFRAWEGGSWSSSKLLDKAGLSGIDGFGIALGQSGPRKYAVYFLRRGLQNPPVTAELRLATWSRSGDLVDVSLLEASFPSPDMMAPLYRVAMDVDRWGLLHLAIVDPVARTGDLLYKRQTRGANGEIAWLTDRVAQDVLSDNGELAMVAMVVDEQGRPHIAYRSGADLTVRYATRYDRP